MKLKKKDKTEKHTDIDNLKKPKTMQKFTNIKEKTAIAILKEIRQDCASLRHEQDTILNGH